MTPYLFQLSHYGTCILASIYDYYSWLVLGFSIGLVFVSSLCFNSVNEHTFKSLVPDYRFHLLILTRFPRHKGKPSEFQYVKETERQVTDSSSWKSTCSHLT